MRISDWSSDVCSSDLEPGLFTTAPVPAMKKLLAKAGWTVGDVDLFEVNEAFAVVAMIAMQELSIPHDKLNVNGGATALGHPIGASGARILATLLAAPQNRGPKTGVASLCRSEEHTSALQSLMRNSVADFCLKNKIQVTE